MELSNDILILQNLVRTLLLKVEKLSAENAILKTENAELLRRLNQNSTNSSIPPSKDKFKIKPALSKFPKAKIGGQAGHKGKTLEMSTTPDHIVQLACPAVCTCGCDVSQIVPTIKECRQVYDLPQPKLEITEYQQLRVHCPSCHCEVMSNFPASVNNHTQYGDGVLALCNMLTTGFHLSIQNVSQLFVDLYGQTLNTATVLSANKRAFDALENTENLIAKQILASPVVHFDESGVACEKKTQWLHVASNSLWSYFFIHAKRGIKALESQYSLIKNFKNTAIHDCWVSYFSFKNCSHAICNAHILRELQGLIENGSTWAIDMKALLMELYIASNYGKSTIKDLLPFIVRYDSICQTADQQEPPPKKPIGRGRIKSSKGRNLMNRLVGHKDSVLAFAKYENVPFTNNQAERDIRPIKTKIKVAGCFRTEVGATQYARIRGRFAAAIYLNYSKARPICFQ